MPQLVKLESGEFELVQFKYINSGRAATPEEIAKDTVTLKEAGAELADHLGVSYKYVDLALDGGAYFVDEKGRLFVSNPDFNRSVQLSH